ncbi:Pseudouridine synthase, TruD [Dillenia turbinata]|uniref:Pseudouridine synthase, TruD n=1 Tax=Dillenia turbinata TaxID=194707 RepID=A0AAN8UEN2_9MAGN
MKPLEESDVGILCYVTQLPGFRGILKQRYSDFIVNEVDLEGNVVHLTSLDVPINVEQPVQMVEENAEGAPEFSSKSYNSEIELFRYLAGDSDAESLEGLLCQATSGSSVAPIVLSPDSDKSHRRAVHNFFKEKLKFLVTDTVDGPEPSLKCIRVRLNSAEGKGKNSRKRKDRSDKPFDSRGSENWPDHLGKFTRFHLYKENKDTQEALGLIGKMLGIQPQSFGFAGTKDKRSISTQTVHANRLCALNKRLIGIKVGDFCHVTEGLVLGQLLGNRFTITLRGVVADSEDTIKAAAKALGEHGFINYFGLQVRFGSGSVPTHLIGAALLRGEWTMTKAREYYKESNDIEGTLRQLPRHLVAERAILQCLKKCPGNYLQALKAIPRTLRMMYVHSYQSFLWNHAASMRVQKYGINQVVLGDIVYCKGDDSEKPNEVLMSNGEDDCCDNTFDCDDLDGTSETALVEEKNSQIVDAEDLHAGRYSIDDVVLPLPGVVYPTNEIAQVYHDIAKKDSINLTESAHNIKELLKYTDESLPLAETDLDKLKPANGANGKKLRTLDMEDPVSAKQLKTNGVESADLSSANHEIDAVRGVDVLQVKLLDNAKVQETKTALKLGFTLPASCYATMAIRELSKQSTSVSSQYPLHMLIWTCAIALCFGASMAPLSSPDCTFFSSCFKARKVGLRPSILD